MMDKPPNVAYYPDYYWQGNSAAPSQVNVENFSYSPPPAYLTAAALNQGNVNQGGGNGGRGTVFSKPPSSFYIKKWILLATISFNLLTMIFGLASVELIVAQMTSKHQKVIDSMICLYRSCEGATSEEMMGTLKSLVYAVLLLGLAFEGLFFYGVAKQHLGLSTGCTVFSVLATCSMLFGCAFSAAKATDTAVMGLLAWVSYSYVKDLRTMRDNRIRLGLNIKIKMANMPNYCFQGIAAEQLNIGKNGYPIAPPMMPPPPPPPPGYMDVVNVNQGGEIISDREEMAFEEPPSSYSSSFYAKKWTLLATISFNALCLFCGLCYLDLVVEEVIKESPGLEAMLLCQQSSNADSCDPAKDRQIKRHLKKLVYAILIIFLCLQGLFFWGVAKQHLGLSTCNTFFTVLATFSLVLGCFVDPSNFLSTLIVAFFAYLSYSYTKDLVPGLLPKYSLQSQQSI
ncbi:hypothetical protein TYRP_023424 [Tyrophagus putrescentiae]|nr:hypothetical protein TYRP_023424 [Tyrophagus putrescentiae]